MKFTQCHRQQGAHTLLSNALTCALSLLSTALLNLLVNSMRTFPLINQLLRLADLDQLSYYCVICNCKTPISSPPTVEWVSAVPTSTRFVKAIFM